MLVNGGDQNNSHSETSKGISSECAEIVFDICRSERILQQDFSVDLGMSEDKVRSILDSKIPLSHRDEYIQNRGFIIKTILHSRYINLYNLLRDHLCEESYVALVRNQILVDVQVRVNNCI